MQSSLARLTLTNRYDEKTVLYIQELAEGIYNVTQDRTKARLFKPEERSTLRQILEIAITKYRDQHPGIQVVRTERDENGL